VVAFGRLIFGLLRGPIILAAAIFIVGGAFYTLHCKSFRESGGAKFLKSKIVQNVCSPPNAATVRETSGFAEVPVLDSVLNRFV
jgi:hypothetical protein